nr:retrovirus-related Pol polyprotein from transposon TNT 1-94 [Tanacetum cinerariifolium]
MTLIEAARTMLADSLLPIPFWAEAVDTACYVQNRILVTKPQNKTPYELLLGQTPSIGFKRLFGYPVTILNTLDLLGEFDGKANEGYLVGYSLSNKAFRVFNSRTRIIQETLHINFLENKPNVAGSGPTWLFDIDTLTNSKNPQNTDGDAAFEVKEPEFEGNKPESKVYVSPSSKFEDFSDNSINEVNDAALEDITYYDDEEDVGTEADFTNLETNITEEQLQFKMQNVWFLVDLPNGKRAIGHTQEEGIDYEEFFSLVAKIEAISLFLAYASFMGFMVYQMDVRSAFLYETIKEEVYVCQPLGFEDPYYLDKVYKVVKALYGLHQAPRAWYETLANYLVKNDLCKAFEKLMKDKFQMSSMGELTFFLGLQVKQKPDGIFVSQDKYVAEILRKFGLTDGKSADG